MSIQIHWDNILNIVGSTQSPLLNCDLIIARDNSSFSDEDKKLQKAENPLISIIVPVYNEENNIKQSLSRLINAVQKDLHGKKKWYTEIVVVDDGSTDNSLEIIIKFVENHSIIRLIRHKKNQGKGAALSTAFKNTKGKICIIHDSDLEYNPYEINKLIEPLVRGIAHVVYGSRFLELKKYEGLWSHLLGNKVLSVVGSILIRRRITDIMTCYKAFRRDLLQELKARSFDIEPEITAKLLINRSTRFLELPISYNPRLRGKKIRKIDGFISLWRLITTIINIQLQQRARKM